MAGASQRRAVFIDRDGTISEEVGYVNHPSRYRVFPYAAEAIKQLNEAGWLAVLITNQAGVARGSTQSIIARITLRSASRLTVSTAIVASHAPASFAAPPSNSTSTSPRVG